MFTKRTLGIIYIERVSFSYYTEAGLPVTFSYPQEYVHELEIINEDAFIKSISLFITANKIIPSSVLLILSPDLLYEKEYVDEPVKADMPSEQAPKDAQTPTIDPTKPLQPAEPVKAKTAFASHEERLREIGFFTESVPFEETASKIYKIDKGVKVVVTNKRLFQTVRTAFTRQGFIVEAVVPMTMLGKEFGVPAGMNDELLKKIFLRYEAIKVNNLLQEDPAAMGSQQQAGPIQIQMSTKVQSKREYALIGVFAVLLIVLGVFAYITFKPPKAKVASMSQTPQEQPVATIIPSETPVASPAATASPSASVTLVNKAIRISISGGTPELGASLKQIFATAGFSNVTVKPSSAPVNAKTLIIFSSTLQVQTREAVLAEIKKLRANLTVQENTLTDTDVLINL